MKAPRTRTRTKTIFNRILIRYTKHDTLMPCKQTSIPCFCFFSKALSHRTPITPLHDNIPDPPIPRELRLASECGWQDEKGRRERAEELAEEEREGRLVAERARDELSSVARSAEEEMKHERSARRRAEVDRPSLCCMRERKRMPVQRRKVCVSCRI